MDVYVARQPVFTTKKGIFGYELLFRLGLENAFPDIDGDIATSNVLSNTFFSFGLKEILSGKPGLVNFTRDLILQKAPLLFPREHIIIEVLENIEPETDVINALKLFRKKGFNIALDDFVYHEKFKPMMDLCAIIKFDLIATPLDTLESIIEDVRNNYEITLLAEKVETYQEFEQAKEMGFRLFQGYFFSKPEVLSKKDLSANDMIKLQLINETARSEIDLSRIADLIKKDVSTSFKLLKFINSAYFKRSVPISTIKDAVTFLGEDELKRFINVVVIAGLGEGKPNELIRSSVIRASMCEQCGALLKSDFSTEELFTLGLFSIMDAMLDMRMTDILAGIQLSDKIKNALLGKDKGFNKILNAVTCVEKGDWECSFFKIMSGTKIERQLPVFYMEAIKMADALMKE